MKSPGYLLLFVTTLAAGCGSAPTGDAGNGDGSRGDAGRVDGGGPDDGGTPAEVAATYCNAFIDSSDTVARAASACNGSISVISAARCEAEVQGSCASADLAILAGEASSYPACLEAMPACSSSNLISWILDFQACGDAACKPLSAGCAASLWGDGGCS